MSNKEVADGFIPYGIYKDMVNGSMDRPLNTWFASQLTDASTGFVIYKDVLLQIVTSGTVDEITIPDGVTEIYSQVLEQTYNSNIMINTLKIPSSVKKIDSRAFYNYSNYHIGTIEINRKANAISGATWGQTLKEVYIGVQKLHHRQSYGQVQIKV